MKKAVVSVTNDLMTDQRVQRTIAIMQSLDYEVTFVGRLLPNSMPADLPYRTRRFKLWFKKGFLFYASYNLRLFFFLLVRNFDLYLANDLDTLLPNYLNSNIKGKPLIYDSHEYFTGVPEIQGRPLVKGVWTSLERWVFPKLKYVVTVNNSIANLYHKQYAKRPLVVRNISDSRLPESRKSREDLGIPEFSFVLINQGAGINVERGMEEMLQAMTLLPEECFLLLVGKGDVIDALKAMAKSKRIAHRIKFVPPVSYMDLLQYTLLADCGLSLDKPLSPNYQYSLPNKLFDFIKCGIPVLGSGVVEVSSIINHYRIGEVCDAVEPRIIADKILKIRSAGKAAYAAGLERAALENQWELEKKIWLKLFREVSQSEHK